MSRNLEICRCRCHRSSGVKHIMACCFRCPSCGRQTKRRHNVERCREQRAAKLAEIREALEA